MFASWAGKMFSSIASTANFTGQLIGANQIKAPKTAEYTPVDLQAEQAKAIAANNANFEGASALSTKTNTYNQAESNRLMEMALPGWSKLQASLTSTAQNLLKNPYELDADQEQYLARVASERGMSAGTRGQFSDYSLMKDFGISSMQYGQNRIAQAQSLAGMLASSAPRVNPMSPISMYITPQQQAEETRFTNVRQQDTLQAKYNAEAAAHNQKWQSYMNAWAQHNAEMGAIWGSGLGDKNNNSIFSAEYGTGQGGM